MKNVLQFRQKRLVTQADLAEERILKKRAILWSKLWEEKKREIRDCLLYGGEIEEGPLTAEIDVRIR